MGSRTATGLPVLEVRGACPHDCPDTCAWTVRVEDGRAVALAGDADHPFTQGRLCAKVNRYVEERVYAEHRLRHPLRRVGAKGEGRFERVGWDEALDDIAARLRAVVDRDGGEAVLPYSYMGTQGLVQGASMDRRFFNRLGATALVRAICGATGVSGVTATNGTSLGILPEDVVHSRLIVLWGTNTVVTNGHLWPFVLEARGAGAEVVVIDPIRTRTAEAADRHVRPLPGTDAALALGMMHVIVAEDRHDADYVARHTEGFEDLRARLAAFPPERSAELTGLAVDEVVDLARTYATTQPSVIRLLVGMEHHAHGANAFRTIACLPALTGAWRRRGGGLLHMTAGLHLEALDLAAAVTVPPPDPRPRSVNMVQLGRALTELDDPPVRALVVYASNPATIAPDQNRVLRGLAREDLFTVVHEQVLTDTARYADYVLPATTQLEHLDLMWSWGHAYLTLNQPAIAPVGEAVSTSQLFRLLAARLGFTEPAFTDTDEDIVRGLLASGHPWLADAGYEDLRRRGWARLAVPDPFVPYADGGFPTPSGRVRFRNDDLAAVGMDPLPDYRPPAEHPGGDPELARRYPLALLTPKTALHFLNSSYVDVGRHRRAEGEPRLELAREDATARGIVDGDLVRVFNDRGELQLRVRVSDRSRPGVVALPSGWWASASPSGRSANALTPDGTSDLGGGGDFHSALVDVARVLVVPDAPASATTAAR